jgi:hypothetical protein
VRNGRRADVALLGSWNYVGDATKLMDAYFATFSSEPLLARVPPEPVEVPATLPPEDLPPHKWIDVPPSRCGVVRPALRAQ